MCAWSAARPLASESPGPRNFCRADPGNNLAAGRPDLTNAHVVFGVVLDRLTLPALPALRGQRVILRGSRESDIDDRLRHPIDPEKRTATAPRGGASEMAGAITPGST
jgi:hypothetical protein